MQTQSNKDSRGLTYPGLGRLNNETSREFLSIQGDMVLDMIPETSEELLAPLQVFLWLPATMYENEHKL